MTNTMPTESDIDRVVSLLRLRCNIQANGDSFSFTSDDDDVLEMTLAKFLDAPHLSEHAVLRCLRDSDPALRYFVALGLNWYRLDFRKHLPELYELLNDDSVNRQIVELFGRFQADAEPGFRIVETWLTDAVPRRRWLAARTILAFRPQNVAQAVEVVEELAAEETDYRGVARSTLLYWENGISFFGTSGQFHSSRWLTQGFECGRELEPPIEDLTVVLDDFDEYRRRIAAALEAPYTREINDGTVALQLLLDYGGEWKDVEQLERTFQRCSRTVFAWEEIERVADDTLKMTLWSICSRMLQVAANTKHVGVIPWLVRTIGQGWDWLVLRGLADFGPKATPAVPLLCEYIEAEFVFRERCRIHVGRTGVRKRFL